MQTKDPHNTRSQDVTLIMWKLKHGPAPIYISTLFNAKNTQHNLRKNDFELPKFETVRYIRHYKIHGASHLVQATQKTKNCESLPSFKKNTEKVELSRLVNWYVHIAGIVIIRL